jgi:hypothetical protein
MDDLQQQAHQPLLNRASLTSGKRIAQTDGDWDWITNKEVVTFYDLSDAMNNQLMMWEHSDLSSKPGALNTTLNDRRTRSAIAC